ncbi:MAG: helix-turn-helix transcriptional regulator [Ruminococcaceae bacterium]|nr:helix-turn-helix transcriptional regulator [Oscillospiraceae bacterium]
MSLVYKIDVLACLKKAGYNTNTIRKRKLFSESTLQKFRTGEMVSADNINMICKLLQLQPGDVLAYVDDEPTPTEPDTGD